MNEHEFENSLERRVEKLEAFCHALAGAANQLQGGAPPQAASRTAWNEDSLAMLQQVIASIGAMVEDDLAPEHRRTLSEIAQSLQSLTWIVGQNAPRPAATAGESPSPSSVSASTNAPAAADSDPDSLGLHVLLAEDNAINRDVAAGMLLLLGCSHKIATNGQEALDLVQSEEFDAVLMDCHMPVKDGFTATRELRAREARAKNGAPLPILALTASALAVDRERALESGMDAFLGKPYWADDLRRVLTSLTQSKETPDENPADASDGDPPVEPVPEFDEQALQALHELDKKGTGLAAKVAGNFLVECEPEFESLRRSIECGEWSEVASTAHRCKSSAAYVGAVALSTTLSALEGAARQGRYDEARRLVDEVPTRYQAIVAQVRAWAR